MLDKFSDLDVSLYTHPLYGNWMATARNCILLANEKWKVGYTVPEEFGSLIDEAVLPGDSSHTKYVMYEFGDIDVYALVDSNGLLLEKIQYADVFTVPPENENEVVLFRAFNFIDVI